MPEPRVVQLKCSREDLPRLYRDAVAKNPLLARLAGEVTSLGWTSEEIVTAQLLVCLTSNASLAQRLKEMEAGLASLPPLPRLIDGP